MIYFLNNGRRKQVSAANISSNYSIINYQDQLSAVTLYHLRNRVTRWFLADLVPDEIIKIVVFNINKSDQQINNQVNKNQDKVIWMTSDTEVVNHADTHYFGANFWTISFTSEECNVSLFLLEYTEQLNIPICTGFTALTLDSGAVEILEFGQSLWFQNIMEK